MHEKKNYMYTTLTTIQNATAYHAANDHSVRWGRLITKSGFSPASTDISLYYRSRTDNRCYVLILLSLEQDCTFNYFSETSRLPADRIDFSSYPSFQSSPQHCVLTAS